MGSVAALEGHLRDALEGWQGERLMGPWDDFIEALSRCIDSGAIDLTAAAHLDFLLRRTTGTNDPTVCEVCHCPCPGLSHPSAGGACPDPRLHQSFDGKCRYCRA